MTAERRESGNPRRGARDEDRARPPALSKLILSRLAPADYRDDQIGDLQEGFALHLERYGRSKARRWYRLQVLKSVLPNLALRLRIPRRASNRDHPGGRGTLGALLQDLRFMARSVGRRPVFYSVIMLVFALGIGANTVIFSVVDGVILKPLPYPEPDRLVVPWQTTPSWRESPRPEFRARWDRNSLSYPVYQDWLLNAPFFESLGVYSGTIAYAAEEGRAERIKGTHVTSGVFSALRVPPLLGRVFRAEDDRLDGPRLAVLSYDWWQSRFGGDSTVVGRSLVLDGQPHTIIGVMPRGFRFPRAPDVWRTFNGTDNPSLYRDAQLLTPVARLGPGVSLAQARSAMDVLAERIRPSQTMDGRPAGVRIVSLHEDTVGDTRPTLLMLLGTVGIFLLIACANIANLLLVRTYERTNELAVRLSLGAGRARIVRQLITEGLTLSVAGGLLGVLAATLGIDVFLRLLPAGTPRLDQIGLDHRLLGFSALLTVLTGVAAAALPALRMLRRDPATALQESRRGALGGMHRNRMQAALLVSQVALTVVLLVGAGALTKSFARLTSVERGFDAEGVLTLEIDWRAYRYAPESQPQAAVTELVERLEAVPGVTTVAMTQSGPFFSTHYDDLMVETQSGPVHADPIYDRVSASFFKAMGIPVLEGRTFLPYERNGVDAVAIVNETLANAFWPGESAVGKRIKYGSTVDSDSPWLTVVGVVGAVRHRLEADPYFTVYNPPSSRAPTFVLKTAVPPTSVVRPLREAVAAVDPALSIASLQELEQIIGRSVDAPRLRTVLVGALAALAATLAVVGIFGVMAYVVALRTNEIGLRLALGAQPGDAMRAVLGRGLGYLGAGIALGLTVSLAVAGALRDFLYHVDALDPAVLAVVVGLVAGAGLAACYLPARRAARIDPLEALRAE